MKNHFDGFGFNNCIAQGKAYMISIYHRIMDGMDWLHLMENLAFESDYALGYWASNAIGAFKRTWYLDHKMAESLSTLDVHCRPSRIINSGLSNYLVFLLNLISSVWKGFRKFVIGRVRSFFFDHLSKKNYFESQ